MRGERPQNGSIRKGLDASAGNEVTRPCGRHQSNTDSNRSLMFSVHFSGLPVLHPCDQDWARAPV